MLADDEDSARGEKKSMNKEKSRVGYLQLIEGVISRMATASALFKGFTATVLAGVIAIAFKDMSVYVLGVMVLPMLGFLLMDLFYLGLERKYRVLYASVCDGTHECDYSLDVSAICEYQSKSNLRACLTSKSITLFYGPCFVEYCGI